jgi:4'-phosphopantetheinyl transferase
MTSDPSVVRLAVWRLEAPEEEVAALEGLLSAEERARARALVRPELRRRFVVARGRLRESLGQELGIAPEAVAFRYGPSGKPSVHAIEFNLAHSGELALCAISSGPVGVDLELCRPRPSAPELARRWFHPDEVARIEAGPDPLGAFYRTWVAKEAVLKLVGVGVGESLPKVLVPEGAGWATGLPPNPLGLVRCWVAPLELSPQGVAEGFAAAIATALPTSF